MSGEEKNKLDELFKKGLEIPDTHFEYREQDWDDFEQLMDAQSKPRRGIIYWLPVLSGVAAVLLIFLGWWLFKPEPVTKQQQQVAVKHSNSTDKQPANTKPSTDVNNVAVNKNVNSSDSAENQDKTNANAQIAVGKSNRQVAPVYANTNIRETKHQSKSNSTITNNGSTNTINQSLIPETKTSSTDLLAAADTKKINPSVNTKVADDLVMNNMIDGLSAFMAKRTRQELANAEAEMSKMKQKPTFSFNKGPRLGLAMMASPDINGAGSFQNAKVGTNIGLLFSIGVGKRLTFSTGASYAKKPYTTDFSNYHTGYQFKTDPLDVYADCRVLDIPINVDYKLYSKSRNSFSVGSGLSSYIMLKEKYTYDYAIPGTVGPASFTVTNRNRHILGVLNLNATFAHQINSKFSLAAQPYLKIPLTDIGNSQVRLQSAGVAVGLRWNINQ
jgi:hypothetical protein